MIDYTTLTIVLVITIAFCIPFVYSHQKKKKYEKRLTDDFMAKAQQHQLSIGTYDLWRRSYMIGIDEERSHLLYIKFQPDVQEHLVDLKAIKNIRIAREERMLEGDAGKEKVLEKLSLTLGDSKGKSPAIELEFYDATENMGLMGEPLLIQKWHDKLTDVINSYKATRDRTESRTTI